MTTALFTIMAPRATASAGPGGRLRALITGILGVSAVAAATLIAASGMTVEITGFARFALLAAAMGVLALWCQARALDPRLTAAAAMVGVGILSLLLCAVVSNVGLRMGVPLADAGLAAADRAIGIDAGQVIRSIAASTTMTGMLATLYNTSGIAVAVLIGWTLVRGSIGKAWELTATAIISMQLVALISPAFPAWGAMRHFGLEGLQGNGLPLGAGVYQWPAFSHFHQGGDAVLRLADLGGVVAFPSFHTVLALMIMQSLCETRFRWVAIAWSAGIILSAVPMGGHYAVDLLSGFAIWLAAAVIARRACVSTRSA